MAPRGKFRPLRTQIYSWLPFGQPSLKFVLLLSDLLNKQLSLGLMGCALELQKFPLGSHGAPCGEIILICKKFLFGLVTYSEGDQRWFLHTNQLRTYYYIKTHSVPKKVNFPVLWRFRENRFFLVDIRPVVYIYMFINLSIFTCCLPCWKAIHSVIQVSHSGQSFRSVIQSFSHSSIQSFRSFIHSISETNKNIWWKNNKNIRKP